MSAAASWAKRLVFLGAVLATIAGVAVWLQGSGASVQGPLPIAWGEEACAHCHMHVGDPRYAAQIVTRDGRAINFDDPGCALSYLDEMHPDAQATYFHHGTEDRWLRAPALAFATGGHTPMGFGLVAVNEGTAGALSLTEAQRVARARNGSAAMEAPR